MTTIKINKYKHTWSKDDLRRLFSVCKICKDDKECEKELIECHFPKCSPGSIHVAVTIRYAELNGTNTTWFASNVPKKWKEVWDERDYYRK